MSHAGGNNPTWRNHYLPKAYLSRFCDAQGQLVRTCRRPGGELDERSFVPKATGFERHLYSLKHETLWPVRDPDYIEREFFGPIDSQGLAAVQKMVEQRVLGDEERQHLATFVNSLRERHPQKLRARDAEAVAMTQALVDRMCGPLQTLPDARPDVRRLIDVEAWANNAYRQHMMALIRDIETVDSIKVARLELVPLTEDSWLRFFTGDVPVLENLGLPGPLQYFSLALDPQHLLVGHGFSESCSLDFVTAVVLGHNLQLLQQCEYVFSREPLEDTPLVKTRKAAAEWLPRVPWRR